jgi:hypothetical protein
MLNRNPHPLMLLLAWQVALKALKEQLRSVGNHCIALKVIDDMVHKTLPYNGF